MSRFALPRLALLRFIVRLAFSAGICLSVVGAIAAGEQETTAQPLPSAGQSKIFAALDQPTEFDFQELPLADVVNYFKQKHKIEIVLDSGAINDEGVDANQPITQALKNIRLRSALRLVLAQLDLTYVAGDGYLLITSKTEAESKLRFKVYPVHDLVTLDSAFRPVRPKSDERDDSPVLDEVVPIPSFLGGFVAGVRRGDETGDFPGLISMITTTVSPTTWDDVGGPGTISENPNSQAIGVSQTDDVHQEIAVLFTALRRVRDEQIAAAKPVASTAPDEPSEKKHPLKVRAYRLMRGTTNPGKSGWRPPTPLVGDSSPPPDRKAPSKKQEAPEASGAQADAAKAVPAKEAQSPTEAESAKEPESAKDAVPAAGADGKGAPANLKNIKLESLAQTIATLVPEMIEPQSWEPSGEGMIRAVGEAVVVRNTEVVQHRVARLMAELLPDCVPLGFNGAWGPWRDALERDDAVVRLKPSTIGNWPQQAEPRPCDEEARLREALLETCELEFNQIPLIDALRALAKPRQAQLYIDHKALADAGVGTAKPVTCPAKGLSCATALKLLLDELDLVYVIRDEALVITSTTEAEDMLDTKVYPVFDLVARPPNAPTSRRALDFTSLISTITTTIAPTTWDEVGGPGNIKEFTNSGALVISQTAAIHEEIAEYLKALREVGAAQNTSR
jgi:hypothetical protein